MKKIAVRMRNRLLIVVLVPAYAFETSSGLQVAKTNVAPVRVCVVQAKYGDDFAQVGGSDADRIAIELSRLTLKNGIPVTGIAIARVSSDRVDILVERAQCLYRVDVDRHIPAGRPASIANMPDGMTLPAEPEVAAIGDKPLILFKLMLVGTRKALLSGSVLPPAFRGHGSTLTNPYPAIGARIVKTLNR